MELLPYDVLYSICCFLPGSSMAMLSITSKYLSNVVKRRLSLLYYFIYDNQGYRPCIIMGLYYESTSILVYQVIYRYLRNSHLRIITLLSLTLWAIFPHLLSISEPVTEVRFLY